MTPARWQKRLRKTLLRAGLPVFLVLALVFPALAREQALSTASVQATGPPAKGPALVINIPSFTLTYYQDGKVVKKYAVAVGKPTAPTPIGSFRIISKVVNPTWYPPFGGRPVPPGPENPLGRRWLGFLPSGYGLHGNNNSSSIGRAVSLGCVRMRNEDVEELFPQIPVGTPLTITYETMAVETDPTTGQLYLVFYPDVYRRGTLSPEAVQARLREMGLEDRFSYQQIRAALAASRLRPSFVTLGIEISVAGEKETVETAVVAGETLLAARPVLEAFGLPVVWDAALRAVIVRDAVLPVRLEKGRSFARLADLEQVLGIKSAWDEEEKSLELFQWQYVVAGQEAARGAWYADGQVWLPAGPIAAAMGGQVTWDRGREVVLGPEGKEWKGKVRGGEIYVTPEVLVEILPVKVTVKKEELLVEVSAKEPEGSPAFHAPTGQAQDAAPAAPAGQPANDQVQESVPVKALEENVLNKGNNK